MELKDFVNKTLTEIIDGVMQAQEYAKDKGAKINPGNLISGFKYQTYEGVACEEIQFDVAVLVSESTEGNLKAGISVWGIGAGGQKIKGLENSTTSRIKFALPLALPIQK